MNKKRKFEISIPTFKTLALSSVNIVISSLFALQLTSALHGTKPPESYVDLAFPLKDGEFYVLQGGSNQVINHHYTVSAQKYALDLLQLNHYGFRSSILVPSELSDFNIFAATVYSPCDGIVIDAIDQFQDLQPGRMDQEHPAGNYIVIAKQDSDVLVVLAHLMKDSLLVSRGNRIQKGQILGKVGNSGNTSEPHLHIHAMIQNTGDYLFKGEGVPMKFNERFLVRNDRILKN